MTENLIATELGQLKQGDTFHGEGCTHLVISADTVRVQAVNIEPSSLDCGTIRYFTAMLKVKHSYYVTWGQNGIVRRHYVVEESS